MQSELHGHLLNFFSILSSRDACWPAELLINSPCGAILENFAMNKLVLNRYQLAERWNCSARKIDRLRKQGLLPWLDLTAGQGKRPLVRFRLGDVIQFETQHLMDITNSKELKK